MSSAVISAIVEGGAFNNVMYVLTSFEMVESARPLVHNIAGTRVGVHTCNYRCSACYASSFESLESCTIRAVQNYWLAVGHEYHTILASTLFEGR